jgi:hypothetical protein
LAEGLGNSTDVLVDRAVGHDEPFGDRSNFAKRDLAPTDRADRRVTAVLRHLEDAQRRT